MVEVVLCEVWFIELLVYCYMNVWFIFGWLVFIVFMVIFYLMVNKLV